MTSSPSLILSDLLFVVGPFGVILLGGAAVGIVADWLERREARRERDRDERLRRAYRRRDTWDALERLDASSPLPIVRQMTHSTTSHDQLERREDRRRYPASVIDADTILALRGGGASE